MTDDQIKHMVARFLAWRLPDNFNPDGGISFKPFFNTDHTMREGRSEPTGTNLLDATQAEAMVRHMLDGLPAPSPVSGEGDIIKCTAYACVEGWVEGMGAGFVCPICHGYGFVADSRPPEPAAPAPDTGEWNAVGPELLAAAKMVMAGLDTRITAAPSTAKPVFNGIAELHDAIGHAEALKRPAPQRESDDQAEAAFVKYIRSGVETLGLGARMHGSFRAPQRLVRLVNEKMKLIPAGNKTPVPPLHGYYAMPAFTGDVIGDDSADIVARMADDIAPAFRSQGATAVREIGVLRDPYSAKPYVLVYCSAPIDGDHLAQHSDDTTDHLTETERQLRKQEEEWSRLSTKGETP